MVDLGQTGGSNSACLILQLFQIKKPIAFTIGLILLKSLSFIFP